MCVCVSIRVEDDVVCSLVVFLYRQKNAEIKAREKREAAVACPSYLGLLNPQQT